MIARVPGKPAGCSWRGFYFERSPDTWIHPGLPTKFTWITFNQNKGQHILQQEKHIWSYILFPINIFQRYHIHHYISTFKVYSKLDFPRCSKHGAVAVRVLESPVCVRDDKRNLRDHVRETFMGWWSKSTLSSCRRTRSGISVSFKPSTVKWFSASLREVIYYESYLEFHHHFYFNTTSWVLESSLIGRALVMLKFEVHLLEATDPVLKRCVLRPPGVRWGNNKDSIAGQHLLQIFGNCFLQQMTIFSLPWIAKAIAEDTGVGR